MSKFVERFVALNEKKEASTIAKEAMESLTLGFETQIALQKVVIADMEHSVKKASEDEKDAMVNFGHEVSDRNQVINTYLESKAYTASLKEALAVEQTRLEDLQKALAEIKG